MPGAPLSSAQLVALVASTLGPNGSGKITAGLFDAVFDAFVYSYPNFVDMTSLPGPLTASMNLIAIQDPSTGAFYTVTLAALFNAFSSFFLAGLPTTLPATAGVMWNDHGVVSIS